MRGFFITGTDTDLGKSVVCAWAVQWLDGAYWKPVQSGLMGETDSQFVQRVAGVEETRIYPCRYELNEPLSPHLAARIDGVQIKVSDFSLPQTERPLVVEGAGGVLVPLNDDELMIDMMAHLNLPVIVVCRTSLGTINHSLMTIETLRMRNIEIAGVVLNGEPNEANKAAICHFGGVAVLGEIPQLTELSSKALSAIAPTMPVHQWASGEMENSLHD